MSTPSSVITYSGQVRHDLNFWEYTKLPGISHSFAKRERHGIATEIATTDKMRIGTLVDGILTSPDEVDFNHALYPVARVFAAKIQQEFPWIFASRELQKQESYTGIASTAGISVEVRGRLDLRIPGVGVIDLKITHERNARSVIDHFGYRNQLWHYAKLAREDRAYILIYSVPGKRVELIPVDCTSSQNEFWEDKILKFGRALHPLQ